MDTRKYKPNPWQPHRCQCVRDHATLIDGDYPQCGGNGEYNGLCEGCYAVHGEFLEERTNERSS